MRTRFPEVHVEPGFLALLSAALLLLPASWVLAWVSAMLLHELGHIAAVALFRRRILFFRLGSDGAVLETESINGWTELFCAAAGPGISILLLSLSRCFPRIAVCGGIQAAYNLLPIYPLDGGRMLHALAGRCLPARWSRSVIRLLEAACLTGLGGLAVWAVLGLRLGPMPIILFLILLIRNRKRKLSCKQRGERVQ